MIISLLPPLFTESRGWSSEIITVAVFFCKTHIKGDYSDHVMMIVLVQVQMVRRRWIMWRAADLRDMGTDCGQITLIVENSSAD